MKKLFNAIFIALLSIACSFVSGCPEFYPLIPESPDYLPRHFDPIMPKVLILSHSTLNAPFLKEITENHLGYAKRHNYDYWFRNGNIAGEQFTDRSAYGKVFQLGLYWQKVAAVREAMKEGYKWIMWLDADALFTAPDIRVEDIVEKYQDSADSKSLFISHEQCDYSKYLINNGVFIIRNDAWGKAFINASANLHPWFKNYATPEQAAMLNIIYHNVLYSSDGQLLTVTPYDERPFLNSRMSPNVAIVPNKELNAVYHSWVSKSEEATWEPGEYILQFSGSWDKDKDMKRFFACVKQNPNFEGCKWHK